MLSTRMRSVCGHPHAPISDELLVAWAYEIEGLERLVERSYRWIEGDCPKDPKDAATYRELVRQLRAALI
jgi:hypothetical protein